jgi:hypothetical protein
MPAVAGCGRLSPEVGNPGQSPGRQHRNRPGLSAAGSAAVRPQAARWPRRVDTDRTARPLSWTRHRLRPPTGQPSRLPDTTTDASTAAPLVPTAVVRHESGHRPAMRHGHGHPLSTAQPADRSVSTGTTTSGHDRRGYGRNAAAVPTRQRPSNRLPDTCPDTVRPPGRRGGRQDRTPKVADGQSADRFGSLQPPHTHSQGLGGQALPKSVGLPHHGNRRRPRHAAPDETR